MSVREEDEARLLAAEEEASLQLAMQMQADDEAMARRLHEEEQQSLKLVRQLQAEEALACTPRTHAGDEELARRAMEEEEEEQARQCADDASGAPSCIVCIDNDGELRGMECCDAIVCLGCLQQQATTCVSDCRDITCPNHACKKPLSDAETKLLLTEEQGAAHQRRQLDRATAASCNLQRCPTADCEGLVEWSPDDRPADDRGRRWKCPLCEATCCLVCSATDC